MILSKEFRKQGVESCKMKNHKIINGNCWVAYFDILGFKKLLEDIIRNSSLEAFVQTHYLSLLDKLKRDVYWPDHIVYTWASDSFVLFTFTKENSVRFNCLLQSAGHFFADLIQDRWSLRGAISYGEFYADTEKFIFVGPALIDAYEYAEKLEMLGLVVTPIARDRLQKVQSGYVGSAGDIREFPVPVKPIGTTERLWAYTFGRHRLTLEGIQQMKKEAENRGCDESVIQKYDNTLAFLKATKQ